MIPIGSKTRKFAIQRDRNLMPADTLPVTIPGPDLRVYESNHFIRPSIASLRARRRGLRASEIYDSSSKPIGVCIFSNEGGGGKSAAHGA